jgi:hypothetical protein
MIIHQVSYIIDTVKKEDLDFPFHEGTKGFPSVYRDYIFKTFFGIDENAYYLYKKVYENNEKYTNEMIENDEDFNEYLPINPDPVQFSCVLCDGGRDQKWRFESFPEQLTTKSGVAN